MKKLTAAAILAILFVPVLITQIGKPEGRRFEGVPLKDTSYREVRFENTDQDLEMSGMLFVPDGEGPFPAAVFIHGSGTSRRDSHWYLTPAQYLQQNGVVVLLPDKRGSEQSEGDWRTASFEDLATDTLAAISFLKNQEAVGISNIGIIGMSQGGHIAPLVADKSQDLTFVVNIVGGAVPMHDLLVYEENYNLRQLGILPGLSDLLAYPSSWMVRNVAFRGFWDAIGNFDPIPYWDVLSVDSLVLYGELDTNVPSARSAEILRSLGNPNIDVRIYEGSGHALETPPIDGKSYFREDALMDIREFISSVSAQS